LILKWTTDIEDSIDTIRDSIYEKLRIWHLRKELYITTLLQRKQEKNKTYM